MDDDLNISAALATIFTIVKKVNILMLKKELHPEDASKLVEGFQSVGIVLNLFDSADDDHVDPEVRRLLSQRDKARSEKNWELADKIREDLRALGIQVQDHD